MEDHHGIERNEGKTAMKSITPHLWFDKEAKEAAELYVSAIAGSRIKSIRTIHGTPSGDCDILSFELAGQPLWRSVPVRCSSSTRPYRSSCNARPLRNSTPRGRSFP